MARAPSTKAGVVDNVTTTADELVAVGCRPVADQILGGFAQARTQHRLPIVVEEGQARVSGADDHALDIAGHLLTLRRLAAPPCGNRRHGEIFAQDMATDSEA